jgi:hypothetical protein
VEHAQRLAFSLECIRVIFGEVDIDLIISVYTKCRKGIIQACGDPGACVGQRTHSARSIKRLLLWDILRGFRRSERKITRGSLL